MLAVRCLSGVFQFNGSLAADTEGFVGPQRLAGSRLTCHLGPSGYLATVNPNMAAGITLMRQPFVQPLAHNVHWNVQFLRQFVGGVQHRQQPRGTDDDRMGKAIFHGHSFGSQVEFCP